MAVSFTVTAEPDNLPPRVRIDLATNDVTRRFTEIEVRRNGTLIRAAAPIGSTTSLVYDYDCDFGETVTYSAEGSAGAESVLLDVTWSALTGWSTVSGTPAVAGGELTTGVVERALDWATVSRLVIHDADTMTGGLASFVSGFGLSDVGVFGDGTNISAADLINFGGANTLAGTGDWEFARNSGAGHPQITSTAGTWNFTGSYPNGDKVRVTGPMPAFTVYAGASPAAFSLTDDVELDAVEAWLIHPINPDLSVQLTTTEDGHVRRDLLYVESDSAKSVSYPAQREVFAPLGRSRQVPVTYGRRRPGEWSLVVRTPRVQDRAAMVSILDDQSPLLLRTPPGFEWDLADDWYSVDTVDDSRIVDLPAGKNPRTFTLPLIPVDEPVLVQGAQWTYADDLIRNPTYADSLAEFPTYFDRLVGPS